MFSPTAQRAAEALRRHDRRGAGRAGAAFRRAAAARRRQPRHPRPLPPGTVLYLPVEVEGALFSVGDTHAVQGDGEVCGTAIESPMNVVLTLDVDKSAKLQTPRFTTPGPVTRHLDAKGYEVSTGIGPDLMEAARGAVSQMIDILGAHHGLSAVDAYMLCSVCADLRISEIVDMPNWVVSFYFPRVVFE